MLQKCAIYLPFTVSFLESRLAKSYVFTTTMEDLGMCLIRHTSRQKQRDSKTTIFSLQSAIIMPSLHKASKRTVTNAFMQMHVSCAFGFSQNGTILGFILKGPAVSISTMTQMNYEF